MLTASVVIIHNKNTAAQNRAQITFFNNNTTAIPDTHFYTINGIAIEHRIFFVQVVPNGVTIPNNLNLLNAYKIYYGADQPSTILRFYNWAIRRSGQIGCDVVVIITDHTTITLNDFRDAMQEILGQKVYVERSWGRVFEYRIFEKLQERFDEATLTLAEAITWLKNKIVSMGYTHG